MISVSRTPAVSGSMSGVLLRHNVCASLCILSTHRAAMARSLLTLRMNGRGATTPRRNGRKPGRSHMVERSGERRDTYVPPIPENVKPKGPPDNAVEMAAGGEAERAALEEQRTRALPRSEMTDD